MFRYTPLLSRVLTPSSTSRTLRIRSIATTAKNTIESRASVAGRSGNSRAGGGSRSYLKRKLSAGVALGSLVAMHHLLGDFVLCDGSGAGPLDPVVKKVKEVANTIVIPWVAEHGFSGVLGFFAGVALKKVGQTVASVIGVVIVSAQCLQHFGYIQIDYKKIEKDLKQVVDKEKRGGNVQALANHIIERANSILLLYIPDTANFVAGAGVGFYLA